MKEWQTLLKKMDFFQGLTDEEITPLFAQAIEKKFEDKEILFSEGDERKFLYVLGKGTVLVSKLSEDGEESLINILTSGEIFPHTGFFDDGPYPGTATAKKQAEVLMVPIVAFERFIETHPELAFRIIKVMNKKIFLLQRKLNDMLSLNVEDRLFSALKQVGQLTQAEKVHLTHQELGNIVGASRETVTRQLKKLEKQGKLEVKKDHIKLLEC
ncbi:Crp/Fnr family transcriptional regulator [Anaerobacillus arseniciselenatis]|uniref:Crp/Fnr family transcriptional regulator n=1 Tax=Anaerobacillus arseniciselenatis TaxID=85682 RepID=A0A1S2LU70_9BACI|nr:Crp/Fnr family transcriptional regulator [Anaerobacillus arseniciselenatis]OIJ15896.1 Crp/Fnr family transcriptional regulator [Anaerobacillus arseniciselenatis]